jgi:hypothetical protein
MLRVLLAALFMPVLLCGCFQASPGGLQGVWSLEEVFDGVDYRMVRRYEYTFNGEAVTRTVSRAIRANTGESMTLLVTDTGTFTVDTTVSPARIDVAGITSTAYPTTVQIGIYAAIAGSTERATTLGLGEDAAISLRAKGLFERSGDAMQVKFGSDVDYPVDLSPPFVLELDREFRLFAN